MRALLNFGHTFGHAIEAGAGYGAWLHGEAVAAGMVMAAELSARMGLIGDSEVSQRVRELLGSAGLPTRGPALAPERLHGAHGASTRRRRRARLRFVVLEALGRGGAARRWSTSERVRQAIVAAAQ